MLFLMFKYVFWEKLYKFFVWVSFLVFIRVNVCIYLVVYDVFVDEFLENFV